MIVYCDTSFLISYLNEDDVNHKLAAASVVKWISHDFAICEVQLLEFPAAVRAATFRTSEPMPIHSARRLLNRFDRALTGGIFLRKNVSMSDSISMARALGEAHGWKSRHTAFGLWHLAAAWSLSTGVFLTFDKRQAAIARLLGMIT
jgi:predicted nucleic acid-binding protein